MHFIKFKKITNPTPTVNVSAICTKNKSIYGKALAPNELILVDLSNLKKEKTKMCKTI